MAKKITNIIKFTYNGLLKAKFNKFFFFAEENNLRDNSDSKAEQHKLNKLKKYEINKNNTFSSFNEIKYNDIKKNKANFGNKIIIIIFLILYNIFKDCHAQTLLNFHSSIITIKINETGNQNIFNDEKTCYSSKFDIPDEVIINGEKQANISAQYYFTDSDNIIQLKWNESRENWGCLFRNCINIINIDFSQFDFSQSIKGNQMFYYCKSITSLNINDFGKVKLKDAGSIFRGMISLTSLNLSNFDTSEVTDIGGMFWDCPSLTYLDLSHFQTNSVNVSVEHMFSNCINLEYINIKNAKFQPHNISEFISAKKNVVFCNEDERIVSRVIGYKCAIIDCSENWRQNQKKINLENDECVDNCSLTNNNKYNYKNACYEKCPIGTYNYFFKCEDCHPDCKICEKGADENSTNCKSCSEPGKYLNFGNCYEYNNNIFINNDTNFDYIFEDIFTSYDPENENALVIKRPDEVIFQITNSKNELELLKNKNNANNISIIDLGYCETILRKEYHINDTDSLIFIKKEKSSNKPKEKNVNFEVYEPYTKTRLNLSICDDTPINIYVPMELSKIPNNYMSK